MSVNYKQLRAILQFSLLNVPEYIEARGRLALAKRKIASRHSCHDSLLVFYDTILSVLSRLSLKIGFDL